MRRLFRLRPRTVRQVEREIDDEIAGHLQLRIDWLMARGFTRPEAESEALRRFGDVQMAKRELYVNAAQRNRRIMFREWLESVGQDVRYALRQVRRAPAFATAVALTLALGIGANTAMFGIVDRLLLRAPRGIVRPDEVSRLYFTNTFSWLGTTTHAFTSYGDYAALRDGLHSVAGIAIFGNWRASMGRGPEAQQVWRGLATPSFFTMLGVRPYAGRFFTDSEDRIPLGDAVAVLSYGFWQRQFGGDRSVLGRTIHLGARDYTIVGIAPRDFAGVDLQPADVWVPFSAAASEFGGAEWYRPGMWTGPNILIRERPGIPKQLVETQATAIFRHTLDDTEKPKPNTIRKSVGGVAAAALTDTTARVALGSIIAGRAPIAARESSPRIAAWLFAMAVIVLLIACGNVINLLFARALARRSEIGVRLAIGADRTRLVRQLLIDTTVLVAIGAVAGLLLGVLGDVLLRRLLIPAGAQDDALLDPRMIGFTLATAAVAAFATGLVPSLAASRVDVAHSLKAGVREGKFRRSRTRDAMLLLQTSLSVILLVGAGLFVRSLRNVLSLDMGFDARHVAMATIDFSNTAFKPADIDAYYRSAAERVRQLRGVESAALTTSVPFWSSSGVHLVVPGREHLPITKDGGPYIVQVSPDYFATAGTRIVSGRGFTAADREGTGRVAIVSETMARLLWPGANPIGKCIKVGSDTVPCSDIVGVAHDARRQSIDLNPVMQYYVPIAQHQSGSGDPALLVRTRDDPAVLVRELRQTMASIEPDLPFVDVRPLQTLIDPNLRSWRIGAGVFAAFGALALLIASIGLYGVIGYEVTQRGHEFGVRAALGATRERLVALVLRRGVGLALVGMGAGVLIARAGAHWIEPLLFETSPSDPGVFAAVVMLLLFAAVVASLVPARRAASSDPASALRAE